MNTTATRIALPKVTVDPIVCCAMINQLFRALRQVFGSTFKHAEPYMNCPNDWWLASGKRLGG